MRTLALLLFAAMLTLWAWFLIEVAPRDSRRVRPVAEETAAAELHNEGVRLDRQGRRADALLYFERAHRFRPLTPAYEVSYKRQEARVAKRAWMRFLIPATAFTILFSVIAVLRGWAHALRDRCALRRLRLRGENWFRIRPEDHTAQLPLRFNREVGRLLARHPLTVVWSSARHGKHMKSRPPVETEGKRAILRLDEERIERLRRYPGDWKGFFYLDGREVGKATARVG